MQIYPDTQNLSALTVKWWKWYLTGAKPPEGYSFLHSKQMRADDKDILRTESTIPLGNKILLSVDKWISFGFSFTPDDELARIAKERIDLLTKMDVMIDGVRHEPIRITSGRAFPIQLREDIGQLEIGQTIKKGKYKAFTDGYWLVLDTLAHGAHVVNTFASCRMGTLSLGAEHRLTVG